MEGKIRLAVFGQKRLSREGGIEIVVKELCTRMAQNGCEVTCYNRAGHHGLQAPHPGSFFPSFRPSIGAFPYPLCPISTALAP